ncbi:hypothetical protein [Devosia sp.]|uniref:hypothetical protein n=1 Tax=Devosia sp. TaxID=1871048 RepID=UPI001AC50FE6|nr:hypothetical protein [Devosia sp.]MBN9334834.1 hypothetical protein [Devosia sp.]
MARSGAIQIFRAAAAATIAETHAAHVALAKREHARVMQADPKPGRFTRSVDGVPGAREEAVKIGGVIRYNYARLDDVVRFAMDTLFDLSPVLSGEYRTRHQLFVGGVPATNLKDWDGSSEILITNTLPYSRKIEMSTMTMRVPGTERVYEEAAAIVARRFGNAASVIFDWQGVIAGAAANGQQGNKSGNRYPCLRIRSR